MTLSMAERARQILQPVVDKGEIDLNETEAAWLVAVVADAIEEAEARGARFEREACAKVADDAATKSREDAERSYYSGDTCHSESAWAAEAIAAAIRARGKEGT